MAEASQNLSSLSHSPPLSPAGCNIVWRGSTAPCGSREPCVPIGACVVIENLEPGLELPYAYAYGTGCSLVSVICPSQSP